MKKYIIYKAINTISILVKQHKIFPKENHNITIRQMCEKYNFKESNFYSLIYNNKLKSYKNWILIN
jgi:hypothetical protein